MIDKIANNIDEMNDNVQMYIKRSVEYYKLDFYKKSTKSVASLMRVFLLGSVAFLVIFFISFALAIFIGDELGNASYGYFIVAGFYLFILLLIAIFGKKPIQTLILKSTSKIFFND
ncbi:MAG: hypothetical protein GW771_08485 [Flavobacteriia bacterium]|nr:hypothetical protein [Flavobacteriia bacterium]